jgi:hypothetical protein
MKIIIYIVLICLITSCSIQSRRYRKGFHIEVSNKSNKGVESNQMTTTKSIDMRKTINAPSKLDISNFNTTSLMASNTKHPSKQPILKINKQKLSKQKNKQITKKIKIRSFNKKYAIIDDEKASRESINCLIMGIFSLLFGVLLAIATIIKARKILSQADTNQKSKTKAKIGLILAIISIALNIIFLIFIYILFIQILTT